MYEYCNRPKSFERKIFSELSKLKKDDVLIHLGDVCIGNEKELHETFIQPLECQKILVRGNHDRSKSDNWLMSNGWDFVCDSFVKEYLGYRILFTHAPTIYDVKDVDINIHGHLHNHRSRGTYKMHYEYARRYVLVSMEFLEYKPIELGELIAKSDEQ